MRLLLGSIFGIAALLIIGCSSKLPDNWFDIQPNDIIGTESSSVLLGYSPTFNSVGARAKFIQDTGQEGQPLLVGYEIKFSPQVPSAADLLKFGNGAFTTPEGFHVLPAQQFNYNIDVQLKLIDKDGFDIASSSEDELFVSTSGPSDKKGKVSFTIPRDKAKLTRKIGMHYNVKECLSCKQR